MVTTLDPGAQFDRYEVVRPLGAGGMAVVVEVRHLDLGTRHALKVLQIHAPWLHERLLTEGRIQATLRAPNVCRVTHVVRVGDAPGLVMELVNGPPLQVLLANYQPNLHQIDALARGITAGVQAAHAAGLVHRDLKPANVLLDVIDGTVVPKVADFGLAKVVGELGPQSPHLTRSGVTLGTPCYMAPEQFRNAKHANQRADQFSLGCLLYELVTGMRPFPGDTPLEVYQNTSTGRYRSLRDVAPSLPGRMADAIARALSPEPEDRFPGCTAFLEAWCDGVEDDDLEGAWEPEQLALVRSLGSDGHEVRSTASLSENRRVSEPRPTAIPAFTTPVTPPPTGSAFPSFRSPWLPLGIGIVGFSTTFAAVMFAGSALLTWVLWPSSEPAPAVQAAPEPAATAPVQATEPPPEPTPVQAPLPVQATAPVVAPEPPKPSGPHGTVLVTGMDHVWLVDGAGHRFKPGDVPPGRYHVEAFFDPARPSTMMDVAIATGERREIRCSSQLKSCR